MSSALNLPNQITLGRLSLAVVFFVLLSQYSHREPQPWMLDVSAGIFILAALTDILDGYLARSRGLVTSLGRVLDPFADKLLVCGAFILFAGSGFVGKDGFNATRTSAWMVVVIVGRELLVSGLRGFNEAAGRAFGASVYGKIKMWVQSITVPAILLLVAHEHHRFFVSWADVTKTILVWLTVVVTAVSAIQYLFRSRHILRQSETP